MNAHPTAAAGAASPSLLPGQASAAAPPRKLRHHSGVVLDVLRITSRGDPVVELPNSGVRHPIPLEDIGPGEHQSYQWVEPETAEPPGPSLPESGQGAAPTLGAVAVVGPVASQGAGAGERAADDRPRTHELRPRNVCSGDTYLLHHEGRWVRHVALAVTGGARVPESSIRALCGMVRPWHEAHIEASPGWTVTTCAACRDACLPPPELPFPTLPEIPIGRFVSVEEAPIPPFDRHLERLQRLVDHDHCDAAQRPKRKRRTKIEMAAARAALSTETTGEAGHASIDRGTLQGPPETITADVAQGGSTPPRLPTENPAVTGDSLGDSPSGEPSSGGGAAGDRETPPMVQAEGGGLHPYDRTGGGKYGTITPVRAPTDARPPEASIERKEPIDYAALRAAAAATTATRARTVAEMHDDARKRREAEVTTTAIPLEDSSQAVSSGDGPRLEYGVPAETYHRRIVGEYSCSSGKEIARSPAHYLAWCHGLIDHESKALLFGRAAHCGILEPAVFAREFVVRPDLGDGRTAAGKEPSPAPDRFAPARDLGALRGDRQMDRSGVGRGVQGQGRQVDSEPRDRHRSQNGARQRPKQLREGVGESAILRPGRPLPRRLPCLRCRCSALRTHRRRKRAAVRGRLLRIRRRSARARERDPRR